MVENVHNVHDYRTLCTLQAELKGGSVYLVGLAVDADALDFLAVDGDGVVLGELEAGHLPEERLYVGVPPGRDLVPSKPYFFLLSVRLRTEMPAMSPGAMERKADPSSTSVPSMT